MNSFMKFMSKLWQEFKQIFIVNYIFEIGEKFTKFFTTKIIFCSEKFTFQFQFFSINFNFEPVVQ